MLSLLYPDVSFVKTNTLRTLVETQRNQGMLSILLTVNGPASLDSLKQFMEEILEKSDKYGQKRFSKLKLCLVNIYGYYAWKKVKFSLDRHLILANNIIRGRTLTEDNVQDFISSIVLKYLPNDISPWQFVVLPLNEEKHYILFRIHHILLADSEINVADLLPIKHTNTWSSSYAYSRSYTPIASPLLNIYEKPKYLAYIQERLKDIFSNHYNEFIVKYDPLENPILLKSNPGMFVYFGILIVTGLQIFKEYRKLNNTNMDFLSQMNFLLKIMDKETERRELCFLKFLKSIFVTFNPVNLALLYIRMIWSVFTLIALRLPFMCLFELRAFFSCIKTHECLFPETYTCFIFNYMPIVYKSVLEILYFLQILFHGPKNFVRNFLKSNKPLRQNFTISGRKIVAWSDPIDKGIVRDLSESLGVSESEIIFEVISASFYRYYHNDRIPVPESIAVIARNIDSSFLFDHYGDNSDNYLISNGYNMKSGGLVLFDLPLRNNFGDNDSLENLRNLKKNLQYSKENEQFMYLLSILQMKYQFLSNFIPVTFLKLILRYLTRKHTVMLTEISACQMYSKNYTLWNDEVSDIIYWEPPQANISISISINPYTKGIRLAVMCDAQLSPNHTLLVTEFMAHLEDLKKSIGL